MKELVVISGKGGTGKTSIVGSFAILAENKILVDCDVDAADLHLILNPEIKKKEDFFGGKVASINLNKCVQCKKCMYLCKFDAIKPDFTIDPIDCEGCGVCYFSCKHNAIDFEDHKNGECYISETKYGPMVHASMTIGSENSGKLVTHLRTEAKKIAYKLKKDFIIIDGSPGVGCPVIASLTGTKNCLIITEPTVSGLHDLKRVFELAEKFRTKTYVCVNKYDINEDMSSKIEDYCNTKGIAIAGKIPYDINITKAQVAGKNIIEYTESPAATAIKNMWDTLKPMICEE